MQPTFYLSLVEKVAARVIILSIAENLFEYEENLRTRIFFGLKIVLKLLMHSLVKSNN